MKWFAVSITTALGGADNKEYCLYDIRTGDVFFKYNKNECLSLEEFSEIKEDLKYFSLHFNQDEALSYNKYIKPLLRNITIDKILN